MTTIQYLRDLHKQTDQYVYVLPYDRIYVLHDGEYIIKPYLTIDDVVILTGRGKSVIKKICLKLGISLGTKQRIKITVHQFKILYTDIQEIKQRLRNRPFKRKSYENQDHQFSG